MSNASVREKVEAYFATLNPIAKRLTTDMTKAKDGFGDNWHSLKETEQEDALWDALVYPEIAQKYEKIANASDVECFPVLKVKPGAKIVVDGEASTIKPFGTSWRDEHSAPFRWETQSQLNLNLFGNPIKQDINLISKPVKETLKWEKKEEETKRPSTIKRPDVPPPPVPPHHKSMVILNSQMTQPPVPLHKSSNKDSPIYAKVNKRKSFSAKTLVISDMKAHRQAREEMKPPIPPRMSLELEDYDSKKEVASDSEILCIPKTGYDFLHNW